MQESNEHLRSQRAHGSAGGGLVSVEVNGLGEMLLLTIDPMLMERQDREMIEDLVPAAVNQAREKAQQLHAAAMKEMVSDLHVPGLEDALGQFTDGGVASTQPAEDPDTIHEQEELPG